MSRKKKRRKRKRAIVLHPIPRVRRRSTPNVFLNVGKVYITVDGGNKWILSSTKTYDPVYYGTPYATREVTWDQLNPGPPYRSGGPLFKFRYDNVQDLRHYGTYYVQTGLKTAYKYIGGFYGLVKPSSLSVNYQTSHLDAMMVDKEHAWHDIGDISSYGPLGWNKARPGNPVADAGVFLGELREVPRMLQGTAKFFHNAWRAMGGNLTSFGPKTVADAWLNTQFGWKPFINDLRKFYKTYNELDNLLKQIVRDNGRWIRRRASVSTNFDIETVTKSDTVSLHAPTLPSAFYVSTTAPGSHTFRISKIQKVWFEGCFRYYIPDTKSVVWKAKAVSDLFGLTPTPSLVWNLTPWSWLVDWCSNVGTNIDNMSTGYAENLASKYAYIMGSTKIYGIGESQLRLKSGTIQDTWMVPFEWKHREAASPFGFGLSQSDFTLRQWSILSALGITRLKL